MARWPTARVRAGRPSRPAPRPVPTQPPPGSYDPAIDAQVGQAQRGLQDLLSDYIRDYGEPGTALGGRGGEDYTLGVQGVERDYGRGLADLLRQRARGGEDYTRSIEGVRRSFAQLGTQQ
jgi:predicted component of type VI protein secretion system